MIPIPLSDPLPAPGWLAPLLYRMGMQTGLRALWNRAQATRLHRPKTTAPLHGATLDIPGLGPMQLAVHPRPTPKGEDPRCNFAIISARQLNRKTHRLAYAYLLCTSHFGCGHLELACYEENGALTFFGLRNMALANASRFTKRPMQTQHLGTTEGSPTYLARACLSALASHGISSRWAIPSDCVRLSVQPELIPAADLTQVQRHLTVRYERLHARLNGPRT